MHTTSHKAVNYFHYILRLPIRLMGCSGTVYIGRALLIVIYLFLPPVQL